MRECSTYFYLLSYLFLLPPPWVLSLQPMVSEGFSPTASAQQAIPLLSSPHGRVGSRNLANKFTAMVPKEKRIAKAKAESWVPEKPLANNWRKQRKRKRHYQSLGNKRSQLQSLIWAVYVVGSDFWVEMILTILIRNIVLLNSFSEIKDFWDFYWFYSTPYHINVKFQANETIYTPN